MISAILTFGIFSIMAFAAISQMDFFHKSMQMPIHMDHSNQFQHINPFKLYNNQLNNHLQPSQKSIVSTILIKITYDIIYKSSLQSYSTNLYHHCLVSGCI